MALENDVVEIREVSAEDKTYVISKCAPARVEYLVIKALTALNVDDISGVLATIAENPEDTKAIGVALMSFLKGADAETLATVLATTTEDVQLLLADGTTRKLLSTDITKASTLFALRMAWLELNVA